MHEMTCYYITLRYAIIIDMLFHATLPRCRLRHYASAAVTLFTGMKVVVRRAATSLMSRHYAAAATPPRFYATLRLVISPLHSYATYAINMRQAGRQHSRSLRHITIGYTLLLRWRLH